MTDELSHHPRIVSAMTLTELPPCPTCGSRRAVPIVYGYPTSELFEEAERGDVRLGGCVIGTESPDYECRDCQALLPWVAADE